MQPFLVFLIVQMGIVYGYSAFHAFHAHHTSKVRNLAFTKHDTYTRKRFPFRSKFSICMSAKKQWWEELGGLPFECTQCGKCCQTKGDVWVNESETQALANHFSISKDAFVEQYAEFEADGWIKLRSRTSDEFDGELNVGCIFLSKDGKTCTVYPARPKQCTTYPFFPRLLRTPETWNAEVVSVSKDGQPAAGRQWTVDSGGCEGMREVKNIRWNQKKGKWVSKGDGGEGGEGAAVVDASEVRRRAVEYEDYFATFPHAALLNMVSFPHAAPHLLRAAPLLQHHGHALSKPLTRRRHGAWPAAVRLTMPPLPRRAAAGPSPKSPWCHRCAQRTGAARSGGFGSTAPASLARAGLARADGSCTARQVLGPMD